MSPWSGAMTGRLFIRPVYGFSMVQAFGLKYSRISRVRRTMASAPSRSRGVFALLLAQLYCVHGGLAWIASKCPGG